MAVEAINNINEVCSTSVNPDRIEVDVCFYGSPRLGMILYADSPKTIRKGPGIFGLKYNNKIYKVRTDSMGIVVQFDGECITASLPKRFIAYQVLNDWDIWNGNIALVKQQVDEMVEAGVNFLALVIHLDAVFSSASELSANNSSNWSKFDDFFGHCAAKNLPVGLRVHMAIDDSLVPNFWGFDNHERDEWGYEVRIGYGSGICSLSYAPGRAMILDFFTKVLNRYVPLFGNNLYFVSPTFTAQQEFGGNYENYQYPQPLYPALFDHSVHTQNAFKAAMETHYGTIDNLKNAWGSISNTWANFSDIVVPNSGVTNRFESNWEAIRAGLSGTRGDYWWMFNYKVRRQFAVDIKAIIATFSSTIKLVIEYGSCNDPLLARYSYYVKDMCRVADVIKADFSVRNAANTIDSISADWINSLSNKPKFSEIAAFDAGNYSAALAYTKLAFDNGLEYSAFIVAKYADKIDEWNAYKQLITTLVAEYAQKPVASITYEGSITVSLSECIHNWPGVVEKWRNAGGSKTKRIQIIFIEDL